MGYAVVATLSDADAAAADFAFQLLNSSVQQQLEREGLEFNTEYLKNLISLMQGMSQLTAAVFDRKRVSDLFISECEKLFGVRAGAVLTFDGNKPEVLSTFGAEFDDYPLIDHVITTGRFYVCNSTLTEKLYEGRARPNNVMVVPLVAGQSQVGFMYLRDREMGSFSAEDQRMAQTLGAVLGGTIANISLHQDLVTAERQKSTLSRYLSPNLLKEVIEQGKFTTLGGKRMRTTILFSDIRGFTKIAEKISPEQMVAQLNEYFEEMAQIIFKHDGTLDKFVGDMVMVLFGVPKPMLDASARAVRTAIEMQNRIATLNKKWEAEGKPIFEVGMGINTGDAVFGNLGSSQAMGLTVIGDNVNQAQRLQAYAGPGEILVSEAFASDIKENGFKLARIGEVEVKHKKVVAYRVEYK